MPGVGFEPTISILEWRRNFMIWTCCDRPQEFIPEKLQIKINKFFLIGTYQKKPRKRFSQNNIKYPIIYTYVNYLLWSRIKIPPPQPCELYEETKRNPVPGVTTGPPCYWGT
jgi:hypothetical protein